MTDFLPLSSDAIVGRGARLTADYVLSSPSTAFVTGDLWTKTRSLAGTVKDQPDAWAVVLDARPGLVVERVQRLTGQVVRVHLITTGTVTAGQAIPTYAVIPGFRAVVGPDPIIDRTYQRTVIRRAGDASLADIEHAIELGRRARESENPVRNAAEDVVETVERGARGFGITAGVALPLLVAGAVYLALR